MRISSPYFAAFCLTLPRAENEGPRIGFTVPRAFGKATRRNRAKRRIREILRQHLLQLDPSCDLVINPRRPVLDASPLELQREVNRVISRCAKS
jgi:ribonuclease P protein component